MEWDEIAVSVLPVVFILVGIALIWLVFELVITARRTRKTVDKLQQQIEPTLSNLEEVTTAMKPIVAKVDPLVERVSLTVDAANLEIMRLDQILENVTDITENASEITSSLSSAVDAIDTISNAPIELVNNVSGKVRHVLKQKKASDASIELGSKEEEKKAAPLFEGRKSVPKHAAGKANHSGTQRASVTTAAEAASSEGDKKSSADAAAVGAFRFAGTSKSAGDQYFTYATAPSSDTPEASVFEAAAETATSLAEAAEAADVADAVPTGTTFENIAPFSDVFVEDEIATTTDRKEE